jgi:predicted nicotinamide N-methyase
MTLLIRTPRSILGSTRREPVRIEGRTFLIDRPTDTDSTLEPPGGAAGRYMPYWVDLWPAARMLAKWIVRQSWPAGLPAIEVGCGLGLPGIAALSMGLRVTFSDCDSTALEFAADNARLNSFTEFDTLQMDWSEPPQGVRFPVILASDLIYEERNIEPLVTLIERMLADDGVCLLTDQNRVPAGVLRCLLAERGLSFTEQTLRAGEPGGRRLCGTLYRVTRPVTLRCAGPE